MSGTRSSGRRAEVSSLALVKGGKAAKRHQSAPKFTAATGQPPGYLSEAAKAVWRVVAPQLIAHGLLTTADEPMLSAYCEAVITHRQATAEVRANGLTVLGVRGGLVRNPATAVADESAKAVRSFAAEFGLTPASRPRVRAEIPSVDDADDFFTQ
jgi:P27 family predicted phage terminase small subunit